MEFNTSLLMAFAAGKEFSLLSPGKQKISAPSMVPRHAGHDDESNN
jgi:hypothetical protein